MGEDLRIESDKVIGSGLMLERTVIYLSIFPGRALETNLEWLAPAGGVLLTGTLSAQNVLDAGFRRRSCQMLGI
jgi:hypothetical protein